MPNDRATNGRFLPGNPGNRHARGRPRRAAEQAYLDATIASVPLADWRRVAEKALAQAKAGDAKAREWLSRMLVGSDPIPLTQLVEELQAELERIQHGNHPGNNGTPAAGGIPEDRPAR